MEELEESVSEGGLRHFGSVWRSFLGVPACVCAVGMPVGAHGGVCVSHKVLA